MAEDRVIGRKAIIQFVGQFTGCETWSGIRSHIRKGMPHDHTGSKPFVVPELIREWDKKNRERAAEKNGQEETDGRV